jgi:hypothetical protein
MANYFMETRTRDGDYVATMPANDMQGEWYMNKADQLRFTLPMLHQEVTRQNIEEGVHEIWLWRDDIGDKPIYMGPLWDMQISSESKQLACSSQGLESWFAKRRVDWTLNYNTVERPDIAWDLVFRTQKEVGGDLRITRGTIERTGILVNQSYHKDEGVMIGTVLDEFAALQNGFDYKVLTDRTFNIWAPRRGAGTDTPVDKLEYGEDSPFSRYSIGRDAAFISNSLLLTGQTGSFPVRAVDTTSRNKYGLMQTKEEFNDARTQAELTDRADFTLQFRKGPRLTPTIVIRATEFDPFNGPYSPGDVFQVVIDDGYVQYDEPMRWVGSQITLSAGEKATVNMYMNDLRELEEVID